MTQLQTEYAHEILEQKICDQWPARENNLVNRPPKPLVFEEYIRAKCLPLIRNTTILRMSKRL